MASNMLCQPRSGFYLAFLSVVLSVCSAQPIQILELELTSGVNCTSTPLHEAVLNGTTDDVDRLVSEGADLYAVDCFGLSPMHVAIQNRRFEMVDSLVKNDFDLNFPFKNGDTVLFYAVRKGDQDTIETLISYGSVVNIVNYQGSTPLLEAFLSKKKDIIELLQKHKATYDVKLPNGDTCLHKAAEAGNVRILLALIKQIKLDVDEKNHRGETPLSKAVIHNHPAVINLLATNGANLQRVNSNEESYVFLAVKSKALNALRSLLARGLSPDSVTTKLEASPLFETVKVNFKEGLDLLLKHGADIERVWSVRTQQMNLLHLAAYYGFAEPIGWLIDSGINVNSTTHPSRMTPLHVAVEYDHVAAAKALVAKGACITCTDSNGLKPENHIKSEEMEDFFNSIIKH